MEVELKPVFMLFLYDYGIFDIIFTNIKQSLWNMMQFVLLLSL